MIGEDPWQFVTNSSLLLEYWLAVSWQGSLNQLLMVGGKDYVNTCYSVLNDLRWRWIFVQKEFTKPEIVWCRLTVWSATTNSRRWMLGLSCVPSTIMFVLFIFMPKSARWLYFRGNVEEARSILIEVSYFTKKVWLLIKLQNIYCRTSKIWDIILLFPIYMNTTLT